MKFPEAKTLSEASQQLQQFKCWQPFRFGGTWYIGQFPDGIQAFRSAKSAKLKAGRLGLLTFEMAILSQ